MALVNYSDLRATIADFINRSDLTSVIPDFITLAEGMMNYGDAGQDIEPLRVSAMETTATAPPSGGDITLAADFLEMKRITYVSSSERTPLTYLSPSDLDAMFPVVQSGDPQFYTIIGSTISIRDTGTSSLSYSYYKAIPPLATNTTNWLFTKMPQTYLYGSLFQYAIYNQAPDAASGYLTLYRNAVTGLTRADRGNQAGSFVTRAAMPAW